MKVKLAIIVVFTTISMQATTEPLILSSAQRAALGALLAERCMKKHNKRVLENMNEFIAHDGLSYLSRIVASAQVCLDPSDKQDSAMYYFMKKLEIFYTEQVQQQIAQSLDCEQSKAFVKKENAVFEYAIKKRKKVYMPASYSLALFYFSKLSKCSDQEDYSVIFQGQLIQDILTKKHGFSILFKG
jgi:hypothetical protein